MQKKEKTNLKILMTGGHARSTAYAVIEEIKKRHQFWDLYWIGGHNVLVGQKIPPIESRMFPKMGVSYFSIVSGRLQRVFTLWTIPEILKIPVGFIYALYYLLKIKPTVLVSFGGYAAFPLVLVSRMFGIPVIIHEQTSVVGRANLYSFRFANKIALSRSSSKKYYNSENCVVVGNPISNEVRRLKVKEKLSGDPTILVTGGASGSAKINKVVKEILPNLLENYKVIHQTGDLQFSEFVKFKNNLTRKIRERYDVYPTVLPSEWHKYLDRSDILISRSGANVVSEIMRVKKPSILIPLSMAYLDEQMANAKLAQDFGVATIIDENSLSAGKLTTEVKNLTKNWETMVKKIKAKITPDEYAHIKFVDLIDSLVLHG